MKNTSTLQPLIAVNRAESMPLHWQIYHRFKEAVQRGLLRAGDRVPSTRSLAGELGLARGTVEIAYEMLVGEGFLSSKGQAGTYISPSADLPIAHPQSGTTRQASAPATGTPNPLLAPFHPCVPAFDVFPRKVWARLGARRLRGMAANEMGSADPLGYMPLRQAIAAYLQISRSVSCSPSQVIITRGYQGGLDLISRTLLHANDAVWMEDPGYPFARNLLRDAGAQMIPVTVDGEGISVETGIARAADARMAVVTPSHQSPTGVALSLSRRMQLLDWAANANAWIVEDDYDGEYRYTGHPLPALKSLDSHDRVIYAGTFSKVMYPALRIGYLVVPQSQLALFESKARIYQSGCPLLMQMIVADFMAEGHFSRHIKKMRALYAKRRDMTIEGLTRVFGDRIQIELQKSGMHLLVRPDLGLSDKALAARFKANGFGIHALSDWAIDDTRQGLLLGFTNIASTEEAARHASTLASLLAA